MFTAYSDGRFNLNGRVTRCALGRGGVTEAAAKREGDGCTPIGAWPIRRLLYRPDKGKPPTALVSEAIKKDDGWCDAPGDPAYNRQVRLPYPASAEHMWREDEVYDLVVVLGHNDAPVVSGAGSAIFLHIAREGYTPTEGCVALSRPDLEALLAAAHHDDLVEIRRA
jgi:L,D-peptidoglycan transpeptidase YkuD (ErfK/YbiS/YcfS/YnhG family)